MTPTVPAATDLLVDAPAAVIHRGGCRATACLLPEQEIGALDGAVRVYEDGRVVAGLTTQLHDFDAAPLDLGRLAPGWHTLTAAYTGGSRYQCAWSAPFTVLVLPATTVADLVVPPTGVARGGSLGVTVRTTDASTYASGKVVLFERARLLATGEVVDGVGTIGLPPDLAPGLHRLFAAYAGTDTHCPSETPVMPVAVLAD
ncbi:hypothetical protein [Nocardioides sp. CER19]|uniref:hypothetical protein n=1 Tax=Nocardioides sp. CER19 TaxID=3038538 RepID=UPI00244C5774|nr:hypothetical protein [Nocardioides sp. CER19]MDH2413210.1 hypothetical protein [Nocardioides sp. CER19]